MIRSVLIAVSGTLVISVGALTLSQTVSAQQPDSVGTDWKKPPPSPQDYNPYPPGILPSDINSELARVIREVDTIEFRAIAQMKTLGPITFTSQPPTIQGNGYRAVEVLGKLMNYDRNMFPGRNTACAS